MLLGKADPGQVQLAEVRRHGDPQHALGRGLAMQGQGGGGGSGGELVSASTIFGGATLIGLVNIVLLPSEATTSNPASLNWTAWKPLPVDTSMTDRTPCARSSCSKKPRSPERGFHLRRLLAVRVASGRPPHLRSQSRIHNP